MSTVVIPPFVEALERSQKKRRLSDAELARRLGITQATISRVKAGKRRFSINVLRLLHREMPELATPIMDYIVKDPKPNVASNDK